MFGVEKEIAKRVAGDIIWARTSIVSFGQRQVQLLKGENRVI